MGEIIISELIDKESAKEISVDTLYELEIEDGKEYWYTIDTVDYTSYYVFSFDYESKAYSQTNNAQIYIYDEDGNRADIAPIKMGKDLPTTTNLKFSPESKYYLRVCYVQGNADFSFKLEVKEDVADVKEEAKINDINTVYKENICDDTDKDWYKFTNENYYTLCRIIVLGYHVNYNMYDEADNCLLSEDEKYGKNWFMAEPNQTFYLEVGGGLGIDGENNEYSIEWCLYEYNGWDNLTTKTEDWDKYWYEAGRSK